MDTIIYESGRVVLKPVRESKMQISARERGEQQFRAMESRRELEKDLKDEIAWKRGERGCSQCGCVYLAPGRMGGFSHCENHAGLPLIED